MPESSDNNLGLSRQIVVFLPPLIRSCHKFDFKNPYLYIAETPIIERSLLWPPRSSSLLFSSFPHSTDKKRKEASDTALAPRQILMAKAGDHYSVYAQPGLLSKPRAKKSCPLWRFHRLRGDAKRRHPPSARAPKLRALFRLRGGGSCQRGFAA